MEKQAEKRPILLADMEKIYGNSKDTPIGVSKDICKKWLWGGWFTEEPYALIGHVRFCDGLLRLKPLITEKSKMKGSERSRQSLFDEAYGRKILLKNRISELDLLSVRILWFQNGE